MEKSTYLIFKIGDENFGVNVNCVLEVLQQQSITPIPHAPFHMLGIINFRGDILPVSNMKSLMGLNTSTEKEDKIIIIYEIPGTTTTVAATADSVHDVIDINTSEIKPVPEIGTTYNTKFLKGAVRKDETFILLLSIDKLFSSVQMVNLEKNEI